MRVGRGRGRTGEAPQVREGQGVRPSSSTSPHVSLKRKYTFVPEPCASTADLSRAGAGRGGRGLRLPGSRLFDTTDQQSERRTPRLGANSLSTGLGSPSRAAHRSVRLHRQRLEYAGEARTAHRVRSSGRHLRRRRSLTSSATRTSSRATMAMASSPSSGCSPSHVPQPTMSGGGSPGPRTLPSPQSLCLHQAV